MNTLLKIICLFKNHYWLSKNWNERHCARCGKKQIKGSITGYKWRDFVYVLKDFNPCK